MVQIYLKVHAYNESHLRARNLRMKIDRLGKWILLEYIVPIYQISVIPNLQTRLWLPPHPPTNGYPAHQKYIPMYQDPSQFKTQPEPTYGPRGRYQPIMPLKAHEGWKQPRIDMYQGPNPSAYNYPQPPMKQMQPTYDDQTQSPVMVSIDSNDIQL